MVGSIEHLAEQVEKDLEQALPQQRKTQRKKLALLVSTMIQTRSANTMDLATALPMGTERIDMRYQWALLHKSLFCRGEWGQTGDSGIWAAHRTPDLSAPNARIPGLTPIVLWCRV